MVSPGWRKMCSITPRIIPRSAADASSTLHLRVRPISMPVWSARRSKIADLGWPAIELANQDLGITPRTGECLWDGRPVDYVSAIDELVRLDGLT
jgi:hypothetical protein